MPASHSAVRRTLAGRGEPRTPSQKTRTYNLCDMLHVADNVSRKWYNTIKEGGVANV